MTGGSQKLSLNTTDVLMMAWYNKKKSRFVIRALNCSSAKKCNRAEVCYKITF